MALKNRVTEEQPAPTGTIAWVGFGCCVFATACLCIAFCSPYWLQTWPMSENRFKNIGLWHVCFYNYMQFKDDSQQIYSGCWWVFDKAPKYYKLREWLTPPWFITCQVLTTGCLMVDIGTAVVTALIFLHCCPLMNHEYLQTYGMFAAGSMMFLVTMVSLVTAILFGYQVNDRYWLPRPDQNYLSWGFGFLVINMICALASGVCLFKAAWDTYNELLRREDEYTKQALELSMMPIEQGVYPEDETLVYPGYSGAPLPEKAGPPSYSAYLLGHKQPDEVPRLPGYRPPQPHYDQDDYPEHAAATYNKEPRLPSTSMELKPLTSIDPEPVQYRSGPEQSRDSGAYGAPRDSGGYGAAARDSDVFGMSYDQPTMTFGKSFEQPSTRGKSYDKSFERRYSDTSFNDPEQELQAPKPERQY